MGADESLKRSAFRRSLRSGSNDVDSRKLPHKSRLFSWSQFGVVLAVSVITFVTLAYEGSVYLRFLRHLDVRDQDFLDGTLSCSKLSPPQRIVADPGPRVVLGCWKDRILNSASQSEPEHVVRLLPNCSPPHGGAIVTWMRNHYPRRGPLRIGLVNVGDEDERKWAMLTKESGRVYVFPFVPVSTFSLTWTDFYPGWIDEEAAFTSTGPKCPCMPLPSIDDGTKLDVVIAKAPGNCSEPEWRRDLSRLQIMLATATVASQTQSPAVAIISKCRPPLNLFTCDELLEVQDDLWLFQVDFDRLRKRLAVPVGACELALTHNEMVAIVNTSAPGEGFRGKKSRLQVRREAYATVVHSGGEYTCGAIVLAKSIRATGSKRELVALVDKTISPEHRRGLVKGGWKLHDIDRIRNPNSGSHPYNAFNYSKFRLWQLVQYDKIVFIDSDLLILRNLDFLFGMPAISGVTNGGHIFNSGMMVIEPSNCTFNLFMQQINEVESYNGGDQGFLNEMFPWWHRIPEKMNYMKFFYTDVNSVEERKKEIANKDALIQAEPPELYAIHFTGWKPWSCFRDYDCNWNTGGSHMFANDVWNLRWWKTHDSVSDDLQRFCLLSTERKALLEDDRRSAEAENKTDQHWKINITDPRLHICNQPNCDWRALVVV
ncbi:hypothetical protein R1sor_023573 [Riccia sorocarpa]|uniref:Hexosyltransferase n=1 Tax=Riccia sorocarpa TaxID=122646 RepID=A0ABD3GR11_9MARC